MDRLLRLHHPEQSRFQNGVIRQRRKERLTWEAESQLAFYFNDGLRASIDHRRAVPIHRPLGHAGAASNNLSRHQFPFGLAAHLVDDLELDGLPFVQGEQHLL